MFGRWHNRSRKTMKQFADISRKLMTPAAAHDARWLKKAAFCSHAFTRCTAIMAAVMGLGIEGMLKA